MNKEPGIPEAKWAKDLAALDDDSLRARLSALPVGQQADLVLFLDWEERIRFIRNSPAPGELVSRLPDEEVLLTLKGLGEEDTLDLLALTTPVQLRFILDVELWTRDAVDEDKVIRWLEYLIGCGEDKVIEFVKTVDRELLVIALGRLIYLIPNESDIPVPAGAANIMPDEYFTILSRVPEETENVKLLLRVMRQWDRDTFYGLLFEVHGSADAEMEEQAFRWRNSRLEEKGLLEFDEALEIYGYIGEEAAREIAEPGGPVLSGTERLKTPAYPVRLAGARTFFARVLESIEDRDLRNRLRGEIAFAANRLLVADAGSIGEIESMQKALDRLFSLLNVGVLFVTEGEIESAGEVLRRVPVRELFQIGFSRALDLKTSALKAARAWWPKWQEQGFRFLGFPEDGVMTGLLKRVPQYYALGWAEGVEFRDFESMDEIKRTREVLDEIAAAAETCFGVLGVPAPSDARLKAGEVFAGGVEEIDLRSLLATGFVNFTLGGTFDIEPLDRDDMRKVFGTMLEDTRSGDRRLKADRVERFLHRLKQASGLQGPGLQALGRFAGKAVAGLEEEVKRIPSWTDLDPLYVRSVSVKKRSEGGKPRG